MRRREFITLLGGVATSTGTWVPWMWVNKALKFSAVENLVGGTGRFAAIRGQMFYAGSRVPGEKVLTLQGSGEYWIEK